MKKNLKKPLKSLMLTAMALLTATATAVNATSYMGNIRIEHIWEDNNNAEGTRPDITEEIVKKDKDGEELDNYGEYDNGYTQGQVEGEKLKDQDGDKLLEEAEKAGQQDGAQAAEDVKNNPDGLREPAETDSETSDNVVKPPESFKSPDEIDGDPNLTQEQKDQYRADYEKYVDEYKAYKEAIEKYMGENKTYEEAVEQYYKNVNTNRPFGADEGFMDGFDTGFGKEFADQLKKAYEQGFDAGFKGDVNPELDPDSKKDRDERQDQVDTIKSEINDALAATDAKTPISDEEAQKVADSVQDLIDSTDIGNMWAIEKEVPISTTDNDSNTDLDTAKEGDPLNYNALISEDTATALKEAGYETTQLRITITLVEEDDGKGGTVQRAYVSLDGGINWNPANDAAKEKEYNPKTDYVQETVISFLHTLAPVVVPTEVEVPEPNEPSSKPTDPKDKDPKDPKDPETPIPEEEVPLTDVEEEPEEEEIPEEEVPLTDVPKTGDNSLLWMCAAMFSGTALLALLKKEKEAQEA